MSFSANSEVELLIALHAVDARESGWSPFLAKLATQTGARFAAMIAWMPARAQPASIVTAMPSGRPTSIDPTALGELVTSRMRPERIYAADELADLIATGSGVSIDARLAHLGIGSLRAMRVGLPNDLSISLGIFGTSDFGAEDGAVLRRLFPHLQAQARQSAALWRERFRADMTATLARRTSRGWLLLDRTGTVIDASEDARAASGALRIVPGPHGDRPVFADREAEAALMAILERLATHGGLRDHAIRVSSDPALHLRIAPFAGDRSIGDRPAIAVATLHAESSFAPAQAGLLVDLFGLLPSEARLAAALAGGRGIDSAAGALGLTIETARFYSKRIFAKTGCRGQADLVRLIYANGLVELDGG